MKRLGFLLMPAGWAIVISALILFPPSLARSLFVAAGISVQIGGLSLIFSGMRRGKGLAR